MLRKQYEIIQEREMCVLDSLSHFGSQDAKENKSSWPEIWEVYCDFSLALKGKCPDSLNLLLKQSAWFKYKMSWKFIHAKQDIEDDSCATLVLGGTATGSWHQAKIRTLLKVAPIPILSNLWDTVSLDRRRTKETQDEGSVPDSSPWSGLCCPRRGSWAKCLRGTRDDLIWAEVLVCLCPFCGFAMWIHKLSHIPPAIHYSTYWLYSCCVWCLYHL